MYGCKASCILYLKQWRQFSFILVGRTWESQILLSMEIGCHLIVCRFRFPLLYPAHRSSWHSTGHTKRQLCAEGGCAWISACNRMATAVVLRPLRRRPSGARTVVGGFAVAGRVDLHRVQKQ